MQHTLTASVLFPELSNNFNLWSWAHPKEKKKMIALFWIDFQKLLREKHNSAKMWILSFQSFLICSFSLLQSEVGLVQQNCCSKYLQNSKKSPKCESIQDIKLWSSSLSPGWVFKFTVRNGISSVCSLPCPLSYTCCLMKFVFSLIDKPWYVIWCLKIHF